MLEVQEIDSYYGRSQILRRVSLQVPEGKAVALLGGNGAGKTTTLKTISGIINPKFGQIFFASREINGLSTEKIVKIGIAHIAQDRELFYNMTVLENLELGATVRKDRKGIERDLQKIFDYFPRLQERSSQRAATLSGGEQKMLAIGRGLMSNPKLLLIDEPSAGLAPLLVAQMSQLISRMNFDGLTILLVEQNVRMAISLTSHSYIIRTGEIVYSGESSKLLDEEIYRTYFGA
jgi:branched-chain amino acid transport system ATP-binding protein